MKQPFLLSASSLFLGFLTFEPPLLGLLGKGDCLSRLWGLWATPWNNRWWQPFVVAKKIVWHCIISASKHAKSSVAVKFLALHWKSIQIYNLLGVLHYCITATINLDCICIHRQFSIHCRTNVRLIITNKLTVDNWCLKKKTHFTLTF